jgi:ribosomal protein L11 methyltransferase
VRELVLRVRSGAAEETLDLLLPIVAGGVREVPRGRDVELRMRGSDLPAVDELARVTGRRRSEFMEREVPDDWRERRRADYEPDLIGGRLVVTPEWAPRSAAEIEIILRESSAFGGATHPTTRTCLEVLLGLPATGSFADLGCGTGVLSILAVRLGWDPVLAVDVNPRSVEATIANTQANDVTLEAQVLDLEANAPPAADFMAANIAPSVHQHIAAALPELTPRLCMISGFHASESEEMAEAYSDRGFAIRRRIDEDGWGILLLERDLLPESD